MTEDQKIVIDTGTYKTSVGFAGGDVPIGHFATRLGRYSNADLDEENKKKYFIGKEAQEKRAILKLSSPLEHGIITNWDYMEKIWNHSFEEILKANPKEHPVHLSEAPLNSKINREKIAQIMFETFNVPATYISNKAVLSLYAAGRGSGIIIDLGYDCTYAVPIYEGYALPFATRRMDLGGKQITDQLMKVMDENGENSALQNLPIYDQREVTNGIKEKFCYVALDFDRELSESLQSMSKYQKNYELKDGQIVTIKNERFRAPEILFKPSLFGTQQISLDQLVLDSINTCDIDIRNDLLCNIVVVGGTSMLKGLETRLELQVKTKLSQNRRVRVIANPGRKDFSWVGGSILASLSTFQDRWFFSEEYQENGASMIHKKCF
ncbi:actin-7-related [Anaeramoeba flamelloides]|uniref:Actin-7-related n=1 Tax=Anaeramoeba flamelloides TaxID=1746091 RepID=A0ABQ8XTH1_9EUKA|nr:actin-7-related [Anaeramoeba flamelloides]